MSLEDIRRTSSAMSNTGKILSHNLYYWSLCMIEIARSVVKQITELRTKLQEEKSIVGKSVEDSLEQYSTWTNVLDDIARRIQQNTEFPTFTQHRSMQ